MTIITLIAGLALLLFGGDALVRGSVALAYRLGISPLVIGLTLVGFGTSMPELVASVQAALIGAPGIAIGSIVGSNIANILLILGISSLILPLTASGEVLRRDGTVLLGTSLLMVAVVLSGALERWIGVGLIGLLAAYTVFSFVAAQRRGISEDDDQPTASWPTGLVPSIVFTLAGLASVIFGAELLVKSAVELAKAVGVSQAVIGLTVVAIGTSLPELVTSVMASLRGQGQVALGNIIGSNIFNILGIAGAASLVTRVPVPEQIVELDVWVMIVSAALLVTFAAVGRGISRRQGAILVLCYMLYLGLQFSSAARSLIGI